MTKFYIHCWVFLLTEFENYESEYDHKLYQVAKAPLYGVHSDNIIFNINDKYITCHTHQISFVFCVVGI